MTKENDEDIWASYTQGVKKTKTEEALPQKPGSPAMQKAPPETWFEKLSSEQPLGQPYTEKPSVMKESVVKESGPKPMNPEPLDPRIERNLSLGDVMIEDRLDLHGKTETAAHEALLAFVEKQRQLNRRLVLVITGKGRDGDSPLRKNVPRWCGVSPLTESVQAVRFAAPHHGGEGAYYLLLRRML